MYLKEIFISGNNNLRNNEDFNKINYERNSNSSKDFNSNCNNKNWCLRNLCNPHHKVQEGHVLLFQLILEGIVQQDHQDQPVDLPDLQGPPVDPPGPPADQPDHLYLLPDLHNQHLGLQDHQGPTGMINISCLNFRA